MFIITIQIKLYTHTHSNIYIDAHAHVWNECTNQQSASVFVHATGFIIIHLPQYCTLIIRTTTAKSHNISCHISLHTSHSLSTQIFVCVLVAHILSLSHIINTTANILGWPAVHGVKVICQWDFINKYEYAYIYIFFFVNNIWSSASFSN